MFTLSAPSKRTKAFPEMFPLIVLVAEGVMVVIGECRHMVPFLFGRVVTGVDQEQRLITVDWDPEF